MEDTDPDTLYKAIEKFKEKYGIKTPLDSRIDIIIRQIKEERK